MQRVGEIRENQKPTQKLRLKSKEDLIKIKILQKKQYVIGFILKFLPA